jgi:hypothetical protein
MTLSGKRLAAAAVAAIALTGTAAGAAYAAGAATVIQPKAVYACEGSGHVAVTFLSTPSATCPAGTTSIIVGAQGPKGSTGAAGPQGDAGAQGPSGVVSAGVHDLGAVASVPTGGGFVANSTEVGTVSLPAGTYQLSLAAKATPPSGGTGAVEEFPQFFVYDQVKNSGFTGDLLNAGAGALESGTHATIDSYFSGSGLFTLSTATTLHVYAFGYDSDTGAGSYVLDDLAITAIQVVPAA